MHILLILVIALNADFSRKDKLKEIVLNVKQTSIISSGIAELLAIILELSDGMKVNNKNIKIGK